MSTFTLQNSIFFPNENLSSTPDLTQDEIKKIQKNLLMIVEFQKELTIKKNAVLQEVWPILSNKSNSITTNFKEWLIRAAKILATIYSLCAVVCALIPGAQPIAPIFGISSALLNTSLLFVGTQKSHNPITGESLAESSGYEASHNTAVENQMILLLDYFHDHTNENRDAKFSIMDKEYTLRDLLSYDIEKGSMWDCLIILAQRKYRNHFASQQLVNEQILDLYFIQDCTTITEWEGYHTDNSTEHGHCYQPGAVRSPPGTQRIRRFDKSDIGKDVQIFNNSEVVHFNGCKNVGANGISEDNDKNNLVNSYLNAIKTFTKEFPSAYVYPWSIGEQYVLSQRWYIILGKAKLADDANDPFYTLPDDNFLNWLFIDDGAGNIVNPEGVGFRYDILRTKNNLNTNEDIFLHAQQIANETCKNNWLGANVYTDNLICTSSDYVYGPKESSELNREHHVYTGDLFSMMS